MFLGNLIEKRKIQWECSSINQFINQKLNDNQTEDKTAGTDESLKKRWRNISRKLYHKIRKQ